MNDDLFTYVVKAYHLNQTLSIKQLRGTLSDMKLVKRDSSLLLYQNGQNSYLYIKDYGSVVFFNVSEVSISNILEKISPNIDVSKIINQKSPQEQYNVIKTSNIDVDFTTISVKVINEDVVQIIMLHLAQSVALMDYVNSTSKLYNATYQYTKQLEQTGNIKMTRKRIKMFIGKTMNYKNSIAENLYIFEMPNLAWNNEDLSLLDHKLKDELDISKRFHGVQTSLNIIKENLDMFNDILQHRYSSLLEWIVIILILFEVIQVIIE